MRNMEARGMTVMRHLLAIALLPFVAIVAVPYWLLTSFAGTDTRWGGLSALGIIVLACGLAFFAWCVSLFARVGQGTLAPWDPTRRLVAVGPYRHARNPMIAGVAAMLAGEALFFGSWVLAVWAVAFVAINHAWFVAYEEPDLERRFGAGYRTYKANMPRWIPRLTPWAGVRPGGSDT
jgi:protein-S-isoprenylcysteine O-methyltransferase Ste14